MMEYKLEIESIKLFLLELSKSETHDVYSNISSEEYISIFEIIKDEFSTKDQQYNIALSKFAFYGAENLNKFGIKNYVIDLCDYNYFCSYLKMCWQVDGKQSTNAPRLELDRIEWKIFNEYNLKNRDKIKIGDMSNYLKQINNIQSSHLLEDKLIGFNEKKQNVITLIRGIQNRSIKTQIKTLLPYALTDNNTKISLVLNDVEIEVETEVRFFNNQSSIISATEGQFFRFVNASKKQEAETALKITIKALLDATAYTDPLYISPDTNQNNWILLFGKTFEIINHIWWYFKEHNIPTATISPYPSDIGDINYAVLCNDIDVWSILCIANPMYTVKVQSINKTQNNIIINSTNKMYWYKKAYIHAITYYELGQHKEALFWLNVSNESMVWNFIKSTVDKDVFIKLSTGTSFAEDAESKLVEKYKDLAGTINWENTTPRVKSIPVVLRKAIRASGLPLNIKALEVLCKNVSNKRNALVHGNDCQIMAIDLANSLSSYGELRENLEPYIS